MLKAANVYTKQVQINEAYEISTERSLIDETLNNCNKNSLCVIVHCIGYFITDAS